MSIRGHGAISKAEAGSQLDMQLGNATGALANTDIDAEVEAAAQDSNPLTRHVVVRIQGSFHDLCLRADKAQWAPTPEAVKAILQQKKFTSLDGSVEAHGDLRSVVLHDMRVEHVKSTFPIAVGARITGVDDNTYTLTGEAFSTVILPNSESSVGISLQSDDTSLSYEFARKFPGYTSENLDKLNVHHVDARRFVLVSAEHPVVAAIAENSDRLQMGEISCAALFSLSGLVASMMPEGLVKISSSLYESVLPLVQRQVSAQLKTRNLSDASVEIAPADYPSWSAARASMVKEQTAPLKAQLLSEISSCGDDQASIDSLKAEFEKGQRDIEHEIDHRQMDVHMKLNLSYNFLG